MNDEEYMKKRRRTKEEEEEKKPVNPYEIKGTLEIPDTRERRDGPGGN